MIKAFLEKAKELNVNIDSIYLETEVTVNTLFVIIKIIDL